MGVRLLATKRCTWTWILWLFPIVLPAMRSLAVTLLLCLTQALHAQCITTSAALAAQTLFRVDYRFLGAPQTSTHLSPDLSRLVAMEIACRTQGEVCAVDWDVWTGTQDGEVGQLTGVRDIERKQASLAKVKLSFEFLPSPSAVKEIRSVIVTAVRDGSGCWKVDDLQRGTVSLKQRLGAAHR